MDSFFISPLEAALMLCNDSGPFSTAPAMDETRKNYRRGFLRITDSSSNRLTAPITNTNINQEPGFYTTDITLLTF